MLKFLVLFAALLCHSCHAYAAPTQTTHYNLWKPADGDNQWGELIRDNFDTIDSQMFLTADGLATHISTLTNAHPATAISTNGGPNVCQTFFTVEAFLDCLDNALYGNLGGTSIMTLADNQTVVSTKTFVPVQVFSTAPRFTSITNSILTTDASGNVQGSLFSSLTPLTTKGDLLIRDATTVTRFPAGPDGTFLVADSGTTTGLAYKEAPIKWQKISVTYQTFSAAATSNNSTIITLPAGTVVEGVVVKHNQAFTGGSISAYTLEVGYGLTTTRLAPSTSVFGAPSGSTSLASNVLDVPDFDNPTQIIVTARSLGANLNAATQGVADIYIKTGDLP